MYNEQVMKQTFILTLHTKHSVAIKNAENSQTIKILTVDGNIIGGPNVSGTTGYVSVEKNSTTKTYVYDLLKGTVIKIFTT